MINPQPTNYIYLNNVRLSFPALFHKKVWENKEPRYEATFILNKETHIKEIKAIQDRIDEILADARINRAKIKPDNICLRDGDLLGRPEYQGAYIIKATNKNRFGIVNKDACTPVTEEDGIFYGGCYVNTWVDLFFYSKKVVGVGATLKSIQFRKEGEPFTSDIPQDVMGAYKPIEEDVT